MEISIASKEASKQVIKGKTMFLLILKCSIIFLTVVVSWVCHVSWLDCSLSLWRYNKTLEQIYNSTEIKAFLDKYFIAPLKHVF